MNLEVPVKMLKDSQSRIYLRDGRALHFHVPRPEAPVSLTALLPAHFERLEVEIGCGKGEFISRRAARHPHSFFVGIDRRMDRYQLTTRKLERTEGKNWLLLFEDARAFRPEGLPSIDMLHLYHPDPWPKNRHHKHRFFRSPDARAFAEKIKPNGEFRLSTDHREYFEEMLDIAETWTFLKLELAYRKESFMGDPLTHFEGIFLRKREPVFKAVFRRLPA